MLRFCSDSVLLDCDHSNKDLLWYYPEEQIEFEKNKKRVDPKYLTRDIQYTFNSQGYRTKELNELDDKFVLILGCSHTEGIGLFNEDIWCNQLCDRLGIDRLNLGKAGSGPDIQYINSLQYVKNNYPTPDLVIIQWPQTFRRSFSYNTNDGIVLKHHNVNTQDERRDTEWFLNRYCGEDTAEMYVNNYTAYNSTNILWKSVNVPVYNWTWTGDFDFDDCGLKLITTEDTGRARDMMHDGTDIHTQVVDQLYKDVDRLL